MNDELPVVDPKCLNYSNRAFDPRLDKVYCTICELSWHSDNTPESHTIDFYEPSINDVDESATDISLLVERLSAICGYLEHIDENLATLVEQGKETPVVINLNLESDSIYYLDMAIDKALKVRNRQATRHER